jgi:hypothetical protein
MKRLLDWIQPSAPLECYLPAEVWTQILGLALESQWASGPLQSRLLLSLRLVSSHWHREVVPPALRSLRAVSFRVVSALQLKFDTAKQIQLVSFNLTESYPNLKFHSPTLVLERLPNLTALQIENNRNPITVSRWCVPDVQRLTSLRALSLVDCYTSLAYVLHLATRLLELRISRPPGDRILFNFLNDHTLSQMTALRSLTVPGQTQLSPLAIQPLTGLVQLNISGLDWGTASKRLHALKPLTQLSRLTMDGNYKADAVPWAQANVSRWLRSVKSLTVTGGGVQGGTNRAREEIEDAVIPAFPQYCALSVV